MRMFDEIVRLRGNPWNEVVHDFRADREPEGDRFQWCSAQCGWLSCRKALVVVVSAEGLFLRLEKLLSFGLSRFAPS